MSERTVVLIARSWDSPSITVEVRDDGIGLAMSLADFLRVMVQEHGPVWSTLTQAGLLADLTVAANTVVAGVKQESARVM